MRQRQYPGDNQRTPVVVLEPRHALTALLPRSGGAFCRPRDGTVSVVGEQAVM
jgi:hypothetical protein